MGFTSQYLRDQVAKLERTLGSVRDLITICVSSRESKDISSFGGKHSSCAANNSRNVNSNEIADLQTVERVLIPEEHPKGRDACFGGQRSCSFRAGEHAGGWIC